jgi:3-deoxy-D-manno-octulosonic-acid transferase
MYIFYSVLLFFALKFLIPFYFFQRQLIRGESLFLKKRLGYELPKERNQKKSIWIHAVSVGEVLSLQNLIQELKARHPGEEINFSSLTNTGLRIAKEKLQGADNIFFVPLDFASVVRKYFETFNPKLFVLAESEFWPNLLRVAKKHGCRVLLINGRITERSFRRYSRFRLLAKKVLKNIDFFLVQTEEDKERLERLGTDSQRIEVAGNLKAEIDLPLLNNKEISNLKKKFAIPEGKKVIVAGSTCKGEEELILDAFSKARKARSDLLLILAPRQPGRFNEVERISQDFPFIVRRRTKLSSEDEWEVLILDTIGELAHFYALSDVAFVGGSLVSWGGHNILEPAFYKKPVFFGPFMKNFAYLAEKFVQSEAARIIHSQEDLVETFIMRDEGSLSEMGEKAKQTLDSLKGATQKTLEAIETILKRGESNS